MKTRTKKISEEQQQMNRWVMELGNYLIQEKGLDFSTAMRKAHLTKNLLKALGKGAVRFSFRKKDGTLRTALGTLAHGICREYDEYQYTGSEIDDEGVEWPYSHFAYWDIEKQGFRSFRAECLDDYLAIKDSDKQL